MATFKTTSSDYTLNVGPYSSNTSSWTGTFTINGNLAVAGNVTYIESSELKVDDPFITVAANNTGVITNMGMVAQKSLSTFAGLRFNSITNEWEISPSVNSAGDPISPYSAISTASATLPGLPNTAVQFNVANVFTGSSNFLFDSPNAKLTLSGQMAIGNIGLSPAAVANAVVLYSNTIGSGGTGLYFVNGSTTDEMVSKSKAIVFGIIF
jgi:hypothetical protein